MKTWLGVGAAVVAGLLLVSADKTIDTTRIKAGAGGEWLSYGRTYDEQRFSPLTQVNASSVSQLGLAWWAQFDTDRGQEATPLEADGVLYTTTAWSKVYAFDATNGKPLWSFDPQVDGSIGFRACCDVVNRGVALWGDKVYVGTLDGRLIALDKTTGKPVWSVQTTDPKLPYTSTGAPRAVNGRILIGNGGAEFPVRGYLSAYNAETGKLDWRFQFTPNPKNEPDGDVSDPVLHDKAYATWSDGAWKLGGGGATAWDAITFDPKSNLIITGTGNAGPWDDNVRTGGKGDNLFAASIVAMNADTGQYAWHYQTTPRDAWDYDAVQQIMTADLTIGGKPARVAMQANKNGFFYVIDVATGKLVSADKFVPVDWAERVDMATGRPVEAPFARYKGDQGTTLVSGAVGGHNWFPMAFSPKTGLVYIPTQTSPGAYAQAKTFDYQAGTQNTGMQRPFTGPNAPAPPPSTRPPAYGELVAWDPVAKAARWRIRMPTPINGGVLATDGGLIFQPEMNRLVARDAATGQEVWSYDTQAWGIAAPMTYEIDGQQYVAVMVGWGGIGGMGGNQPRRMGRLLVFKLGGTAKEDAYPPYVPQPPLDVSKAVPSSGDADRGGLVYAEQCLTCHRGGVFLPNLSRSPLILYPDGFKAVVLDGALSSQGMASFKAYITPAELEDLRAFLLWQAKTAPATAPQAPARLEH